MLAIALSTEDNPWNPIDNFYQWYIYDMLHGYNTCELLARFSRLSNDNSFCSAEEERYTAHALNDICKDLVCPLFNYGKPNNYIIVSKEIPDQNESE